MYGNEAEIGRALRDSGVERRDVFVTTKLPAGNVGRERETLASSLRALGIDYVDLWLVHWPPQRSARPQTWREFLAVHEQGLARTVGVSNYSIGQIDELTDATGQAPAVNQIPWSPRLHDPRLLAAHGERGVVVEGYSPLKGTDLRDPVLAGIAAKHAGDTRPGRAPLAYRARDRRHTEVRRACAHRLEFRPVRLLARSKRGRPHRRRRRTARPPASKARRTAGRSHRALPVDSLRAADPRRAKG